MSLKIRQKLLASFGVMLIPIFILLAISGYNGMIIYRALHKVEAISVEIGLVSDLIIAVERVIMPPNDYLITGDAGERGRFRELDADVEKAFADLLGLHIVKEYPEEVFLLNAAKKDYKRMKALAGEILAIEEPAGNREGAKLMKEMDIIAKDEIFVHLMAHREIDKEEFREMTEAADRAWWRSWLIMAVGAFILIGIGAIFALIYSRTFVKPIEDIHNGADAIAGGDFKTRVDVRTGDEVEQLAGAMNEMAVQLDDFYSGFEEKVRERTKELEAEQDRLRRVFEAMEDGVYIVNQNYDIEYINPVLEKEFGHWEGRKCYTYFHERTEVCPWCPNERVWAGETVRWEWYSPKNGKTYDLLDTPLKNPDGSVSKLEIFRDITESKQMGDDLNKKLDELERFRKATVKREFRMKELKDEKKRLKERIGELEGK